MRGRWKAGHLPVEVLGDWSGKGRFLAVQGRGVDEYPREERGPRCMWESWERVVIPTPRGRS